MNHNSEQRPEQGDQTMYDMRLHPGDPPDERNPLHYRLKAPPTSQPYRVRTIGHIYNNPNHASLGTYFDDAMLLIFLAGSGSYQRGNEKLNVARGMIALILPDQEPGLLQANPNDPYEHLLCRFAGQQAIETASRIVKEQGGHSFFKFKNWEQAAHILRTGIALWPGREGIRPGDGGRLRQVDAVLAQTLAYLDIPSLPMVHPLNAHSLWEYMHVNLSNPINLEQAALAFGISKQHLCKIAKRDLGQSMGNAWTSLKMDWAKSLLQHEQFSVSEVASKVGYEDPLYFSRVFRKRVGTSPRAWRGRHINHSS